MEFVAGVLVGAALTVSVYGLLRRSSGPAPPPFSPSEAEDRVNRRPFRSMFDGYSASRQTERGRRKLPRGGSSAAPPTGGT